MSVPASHRNAQGGYPNSLHPHTVGNHALLVGLEAAYKLARLN